MWNTLFLSERKISVNSSYIFDTQISADDYDTFVTSQKNCNVLQSACWAEVKDSWDSFRACVRDTQGNIIAAGLILIRPIKCGFTMWYLPHGPILDYSDHAVLVFFLDSLKKLAQKSSCIFIKIDPPVPLRAAKIEELTSDYSADSLEIRDVFQESGFRHLGFTEKMSDTLQPRFTTATLRPPEGESILQHVPKRTRRFVKDAVNRYVEVRRANIEALDDFMFLIAQTEEAKSIYLRSREYFEKIFDVYGNDVLLYIAYLNVPSAIKKYRNRISETEKKLSELGENANQKRREYEQQIKSHQQQIDFLEKEHSANPQDVIPLAGCLSVLYGTGLEMLYAGMNRHFSKITAQDLVYIQSMTEAFDRGAQYCSIGGVSNTLDDGLMKFKSHFNPIVIEKLGEFDFPIRKLMYRVVKFFIDHRE
ncbi:peptidoglycan bridge formation glycyltransferase FemA/FemB family protein [Schaalia sp. lx-260]|uniref:peptidoglycan bridge formation glycyltransferase FemA/FemB family protein n=1 Tax=Schaalia sp. lx-260 TaxID=2899082 RepID=UPI001E365A2F|nr:peptidoglycan bridge formation glycyltransferase FemA/FemB family protein [Schaalia sp. lx-260]MCD4549132.1 aminoacyltransferase [Schaalia sp. lx-260]